MLGLIGWIRPLSQDIPDKKKSAKDTEHDAVNLVSQAEPDFELEDDADPNKVNITSWHCQRW